MSTIEAEKTALRRTVRQVLAGMSSADRRASDQALFEAFLNLTQVKTAKSILLFRGVGLEPETANLISPLRDLGKIMCFPKSLPGSLLEIRQVEDESALVPGTYGIPEPGEECPLMEPGRLDLVLVPALCYDKHCFRLGQGGGYYDRFLERYSGYTVGFCRDAVLQENVPVGPHDRCVHCVLTEKRRFSRKA
ncbi:putative protein YqgN [bioreactor metagenome]|uniref:5-formyltetrahydrofolate cyclo-ligase n=1 Tax=bioreactor metagenome TaxID=1076179 RepID=A0A644XLD6_9ZZZZ